MWVVHNGTCTLGTPISHVVGTVYTYLVQRGGIGMRLMTAEGLPTNF